LKICHPAHGINGPNAIVHAYLYGKFERLKHDRSSDDFGNMDKDLQFHTCAVGGSTPSVAYAHEDGFYNNTRLTAMTYPNGRVVQMGYGTTGGGTI
jgi:hypothetical protein